MGKKKVRKVTEDVVVELLKLLGVKASVEIFDDKQGLFYKNEEAGSVKVLLSTDDPAVLIGRHGGTLESLQTILAQIIYAETGEWHRILVDSGDYRVKRQETLENLAFNMAARAKETGLPQPIYDLTPSDRRVVHLALSQDSTVTTESVGEGRERYLVVKLKKQP